MFQGGSIHSLATKNSMSSIALITGAYGFLGRNTALAFSQAGYHVIGMGHGSWVQAEFQQFGIDTWHSADITLDSMVDLAVVPDVVVHCAGSGSVGFSMSQPYHDFLSTVSATAAVLEFVRTCAPSAKVVYPSSAAVYGAVQRLPIAELDAMHPISAYGVHKMMAEDLCRAYAHHFKVAVSIVRFFSVYGEGLRKQLLWDASQKIVRGESDFFGTGDELRDWLHVTDAARLMLNAVDSSSQECPVFNGGMGVAVSVNRILEQLFACYGSECFPVFSGVKREGDPQGYVADITKAASIGWSPAVDWASGIKAYAEWFKQEVRS